MLTDTQEGKVLLNEVAYQIVCEQAPEELPLYVEIRDEYLSDPQHFLETGEGKDEALGIGEVALVTTFTRAVFPIVAPVLQFLLEKLVETFQEELGEETVAWVKQLFDSDKPPQPIFSQTDLEVIAATIRDIARSEADRLGLEDYQARSVSDAVIARLALAKA